MLELFNELAELVGEVVHGLSDASQSIERHDNGKAGHGDSGS